MMPVLMIEAGKDYSTLADGNRLYKAKLEKMFGPYQSFDAIKERAKAVHLDEMEFSISDNQSYEVPKEVIFNPSLIPDFSYWPVQDYALEGLATREVARIRAFSPHR